MLKKVTKSAKSLDEALELAAKELNVSVDEVSYDVVRETGKNLFSKFFLGSEIEISAWITKEAEALEKKEKAAKAKPAKTEQPKTVEKKQTVEKKAEKAEVKTEAKAEPKTETAPVQTVSENNTDIADEPKSFEKKNSRFDEEIEIPTEAVTDAKKFLSELLSKMGIEANLYVKLGKNSIDIDVSGEKMGLLIGKRGDTLDAVQYLTSLYVNRSKERYIKINIDTENYRSKREETLVRLAHGLERRVLREKKSITLEPMSPNERRIIHAALQRNTKIKTYSIGDEPNRKVVVALNK